jgi:hypoxia up-regulated 1
MDGEDAQAKEFEERLDLLTSIGDPIFFRYTTIYFKFIVFCFIIVNLCDDLHFLSFFFPLCNTRLAELTARPSACEYARSYLDEVQKVNISMSSTEV